MKTLKIFLCAITVMTLAYTVTSCKTSNNDRQTEEDEVEEISLDALGVCLEPDTPASYPGGSDSLIIDLIKSKIKHETEANLHIVRAWDFTDPIEIEFIVTKTGHVEDIEYRAWKVGNESDRQNEPNEPETPTATYQQLPDNETLSQELKAYLSDYFFTPAAKDGKSVDTYYKISISPETFTTIYSKYSTEEVQHPEVEILVIDDTDNEQVYDVVEQAPQFPGGEVALLNIISNNIRYPATAVENGDQGIVVVRFVVTRTGDVGNVVIARGKTPELDKEAVRVVKELPKFIPGKQNGKTVNVWYTLPIRFKLPI